jgi:hypothetical protein
MSPITRERVTEAAQIAAQLITVDRQLGSDGASKYVNGLRETFEKANTAAPNSPLTHSLRLQWGAASLALAEATGTIGVAP